MGKQDWKNLGLMSLIFFCDRWQVQNPASHQQFRFIVVGVIVTFLLWAP